MAVWGGCVNLKFGVIQLNQGVWLPVFCLADFKYWIPRSVFIVLLTGMAVRMPQTTAYVVNNGLSLGSGAPQLTVHHRPPQVHAVSTLISKWVKTIYRLVSELACLRLLLSVNCRKMKCLVDTFQTVYMYNTTVSPTESSAKNSERCVILLAYTTVLQITDTAYWKMMH